MQDRPEGATAWHERHQKYYKYQSPHWLYYLNKDRGLLRAGWNKSNYSEASLFRDLTPLPPLNPKPEPGSAWEVQHNGKWHECIILDDRWVAVKIPDPCNPGIHSGWTTISTNNPVFQPLGTAKEKTVESVYQSIMDERKVLVGGTAGEMTRELLGILHDMGKLKTD